MTRMECGQSVTDIIERGMVSVARSFRCMNFLLLGNELVSVLDGERSSTIHVEPEVWTEGSFNWLARHTSNVVRNGKVLSPSALVCLCVDCVDKKVCPGSCCLCSELVSDEL